MKISITFVDDEREKVMELVAAAKRIMQIRRFKEPAPKDGFSHIYMTAALR